MQLVGLGRAWIGLASLIARMAEAQISPFIELHVDLNPA